MALSCLLVATLELVAGLASADDGGGTGAIPGGKEAAPAFKKTASGLEYRILRKGKGAKPGPKSKVEVHYKGWLDDQTVFDSSYARKQTATFPLNAVIAGWTEGLQLVREGGQIELRIPAKLGYGDRGVKNVIPGGARLHFQVELIAIRQ